MKKETTENILTNLTRNLNPEAMVCFGFSEGLGTKLANLEYDRDSLYFYKPAVAIKNRSRNRFKIFAIGSSTGGTQAVETVLKSLRKSSPPIVVVQHLPADYVKSFVERLNNIATQTVVEATHGQELKNNFVYIAPGNKQMSVENIKGRPSIVLSNRDNGSGHKPSVDFLFNSLSRLRRADIAAALLTGMGKDGAEGLKKLREQNHYTIAQDEKSSVVFGMPRAAIELNAAEAVLDIEKIGDRFISLIAS